MSPAFDFDVSRELSDMFVLALLSTGLSSSAVRFVLIMRFDLIPYRINSSLDFALCLGRLPYDF